jgi:hypothetical protein
MIDRYSASNKDAWVVAIKVCKHVGSNLNSKDIEKKEYIVNIIVNITIIK